VRELAERTYFLLCSALGRLLRSARYSKVRIVSSGSDLQVRKHRSFYAPLLVWLSGPLVRMLDTGVRVLAQRDWEERERRVYERVYGVSIRIESGGVLVLPCFAGVTLGRLLEDPALDDSTKEKAIGLAVIALGELHARGFTHGDAMAENVLVDLETGIARWFDFETAHDSTCPTIWRHADDVRALLVTCLLRVVPEKRAEFLHRILNVYGDEELTRILTTSFRSAFQRPLSFHLGQADLSFRSFREIDRLLSARLNASLYHARRQGSVAE
jgi:hypothetical protein